MINSDTTINKKVRFLNNRILWQDIGLLFFMACVFLGAAIIAFSTGQEQIENIFMFVIMAGVVILAAYKFRYIAIALSIVQTCFYAIYKMYFGLFEDGTISVMSYIWLALPVLSVLSMVIFTNNTYKMEAVAELLERQIEENIMTDRVTKLYNLKCMYIDLERQMAYSKRNDTPISLMIIQLRYEQELRSILTTNQFEDLRRVYAQILEDVIRLEDRLYAIDDKGSMGIICTCDGPGAHVLKSRIQNTVAKQDAFRAVMDKAIKVDLRFGICQYDEETITNSVEFKKKAENELQYDV